MRSHGRRIRRGGGREEGQLDIKNNDHDPGNFVLKKNRTREKTISWTQKINLFNRFSTHHQEIIRIKDARRPCDMSWIFRCSDCSLTWAILFNSFAWWSVIATEWRHVWGRWHRRYINDSTEWTSVLSCDFNWRWAEIRYANRSK